MRSDRPKENWPALALRHAALAAAVFGVGLLSPFAMLEGVHLLRPTSGLALAAVVLGGPRCAIALAAGAFGVALWGGAPPTASLVAGAALALEGLLGAALLKRFSFAGLERVRDTFAMVCVAVVAPGVVGILAAAARAGGGDSALLWRAWWTWWLAGAMGVVVVTPTLLAWAGPRRRSLGRPAACVEGLVAVAVAALVQGGLFGGWMVESVTHLPLTFVAFPILAWVAIRFSPLWATTAVFLSAAVAVAGSAAGHGPFTAPGVGRSAALVWAYLGTLSLTVLLMNAQFMERRAAGALRDRLAAVIEATSDFVGTADAAGRILTINRGGRRLLGVGDDESLRGRQITTIHPPWAAERLRREALPAADRAGEWRGETALLASDGREVPVSQVVVSHKGSDGRTAYYSTIMRDTSGAREAMETLRDREARLRLLMDQVPAVLWTTDRALRFTSSVGSGLEGLGQEPNEVVGRSLQDLLGVDDPDFPPLTAAQAALEGAASSYEFEWGGSTFRAHVEPLRDGSDAIVGVVGVALDITPRARAEEALRRSEQRYRVLVEGVNIIGWEADPASRRYTFVSRRAEALTGYPAREWLAPGFWASHLHPDDREHTLNVSDERSRRGEPFEIEYRFMTADGRTLWFRDYISVETAGSRPVRLSGVIIDTTGQKQLEAQLLHAHKLESIGRLAGGIAHDFNNILTAVLGCLDLIDIDLGRGHASAAHVATARKASEHAAGLTRQLLAFARRQVIEPKVADLRSLVRGTESLLRRLLGEDIDLEIRPAPEPCPARIDAGQFEQILVNLAVNARDAMPAGGRLTLCTRSVRGRVSPGDGAGGADEVVLTVGDTGVGMDESVRRHLFEPFFTTKGPGKGTGLGLATVHGIVEQHGGRIRIDSSPGTGARFEIYLPRASDFPLPIGPGGRAGEPGPTGKTVLLLEDEPLVRSVTAITLRSQGFEVLEAADPDAALGISAEHNGPIDLLLTDVVLPTRSGTEAAAMIKAGRPEIRILYTSGHTDDSVVHHGVMADTVDFLQKPFTPAMLAAKVRQVLARPRP